MPLGKHNKIVKLTDDAQLGESLQLRCYGNAYKEGYCYALALFNVVVAVRTSSKQVKTTLSFMEGIQSEPGATSALVYLRKEKGNVRTDFTRGNKGNRATYATRNKQRYKYQ